MGTGHLYKLPGFADAPSQLKSLLKHDQSVRDYLENSIQQMVDGTDIQVESDTDDIPAARSAEPEEEVDV